MRVKKADQNIRQQPMNDQIFEANNQKVFTCVLGSISDDCSEFYHFVGFFSYKKCISLNHFSSNSCFRIQGLCRSLLVLV